MSLWKERMKGEIIGITINVDERSITGNGSRWSREHNIKVYLSSNQNDPTGRDNLIMQESRSLQDKSP